MPASATLTVNASAVIAAIREAAALIDRLPEPAVVSALVEAGCPRSDDGGFDLSAFPVCDGDLRPASGAGEGVLALKVGDRLEVLLAALRAADSDLRSHDVATPTVGEAGLAVEAGPADPHA